MKKEYKANNIFNENGVTLNKLISTFLVSFLDKELNLNENSIINNHIISNL